MFSTMKLWLTGIGAALVAGLYALLKIKSKQLDVAEEIIEHQKEELHVVHVEKEVSDQIRKELSEEEEEIERKYEIQKKAIESLDDKPLSDDLIQLLCNRSNKK